MTLSPSNDELRNSSAACLIGGAVGDALGAPVEFMKRSEILAAFGNDGLTAMAPAYGRPGGAITDDTQMMLFTAEGLLRGYVRGRLRGITSYTSCIHHAYLRWLMTQGRRVGPDRVETDGWLYSIRGLHSARAPGNTCLSALASNLSRGSRAENNSKGCGGVMRVAPIGLFYAVQHVDLDPDDGAKECFSAAVEAAALTHGHPTGSLSAGAFAEIIYWMMFDVDCRESVIRSIRRLRAENRSEETVTALELALHLSEAQTLPHEAISEIGEGWVAEEALAIGVYCALASDSYRTGVVRAVNHDGDSDSTGLIAGHLLGLSEGIESIPDAWLEPLELREVIGAVADDIAAHKTWYLSEWGYSDPADKAAADEIWERYPGH